MTINRLSKINQIANSETTRKIFTASTTKSVWHVDSLRTGKPYQVTLEWSKNGAIAVLSGSLYTFDHKEAKDGNHPANSGNSSICYQVLGAAKRMASEKGKSLSFCKSEKDAKRLSNLGGDVIKIVKPSGKIQWAVVKDKVNRIEKFNARVNLLRGEVEEGIE